MKTLKYILFDGTIIEYSDYKISENGEVYSYKRNNVIKLKQHPNHRGYLYVGLSINGKLNFRSVHRCVLSTYKENEWFEGAECNHKDECITNNNIDNLEWLSSPDNHNYGSRNKRTGDKNHLKLNKIGSEIVLQYDKNENFIEEWPSFMEIKRQLGYSCGSICDCCKGKRKTAYGYIWRYKKVA